MVRYSPDGLLFLQFVFLANMAVLKKTVNLALAAVLSIITVAVKIIMTRICRSRFEQDNVMEAATVSGTGQPIEPAGSKEDEDIKISHTSRFHTYAGGPRFQCSLESLLEIPFRNRQRSFSRLDSVNENNLEEQLGNTPRQSGGTSDSTSLVQKHSLHPTWDDQPHHVIPHDNPYYSRPFASALWLPRNPCGVLDLDHTIDPYRSLASEHGAGDLVSNQPPSPSGTPMTPIFESPVRSLDVEHGPILLSRGSSTVVRKKLICLRASGTGCWRWTGAKNLNGQMDAAHPFSVRGSLATVEVEGIVSSGFPVVITQRQTEPCRPRHYLTGERGCPSSGNRGIKP
ncbi:hypothetical protein EDD16DRAFT_599109 [Pisolithus croceorrhizus]|nr:hypothetical protein EDD16DRAFT_599109 [Pisolithus croceorrhizus]